MTDRGVQYQALDQSQVDEICRRHELLWSGRPGGARAAFTYCIMDGLDLSNRDLSDADFTGSSLVGANLSGCVLNHRHFRIKQ